MPACPARQPLRPLVALFCKYSACLSLAPAAATPISTTTTTTTTTTPGRRTKLIEFGPKIDGANQLLCGDSARLDWLANLATRERRI